MMKRRLLFLLTVIILIIGVVSVVYGDAGPKPSLEILVENPPDTDYYLDLLVDYTKEHLYQFIEEDEIEHKELFKTLKEYNVDGWRPALATGTRVPLHGNLAGEIEGNYVRHYFSYMGVPDRFKIIVVTADNEISISENVFERKSFNTKAYFNYDTKIIWEESYIISYIKQYASTLLATLFIEGLILLLFRFNLKKNLKPFLIINVITQMFLATAVNYSMYHAGIMLAILAYMAAEMAIIVIESILFSKFLEGHTKKRRIFYAITANLASFAAGLIITLFNNLG